MADKTYSHTWMRQFPGDYPRWTRWLCIKCGAQAQFHNSYSVREQTKDTCPEAKVKPTPESVAKFKKNQEERDAQDNPSGR